MAPVLEVRALEKRYGSARVLRDVSFAIPAGAFVVVTGRSGSGKSTLFKLLAGLDRPTSGDVLLEGRAISSLKDEEISDVRLKRIGLVFQSFNLLPDLTALENVRLPLDIAGVPRREAQARAHELLALVGVAHRAAALPNLLSGGESQRVAVARALANNPAILLADEPTGSLDRANAENVLALLEEVNAKLGTTVVLITHDPLAMARGRARLHIEDGEVAWVEPLAPVTRARG